MFKGGCQDVSIDQSSFYDVNPIALKLFFQGVHLGQFRDKGFEGKSVSSLSSKGFSLG